jgi:prefoldin subunit 5
VKCPSCGKYVRRSLVPKEMIKVVDIEEIEPEEAEEREEEEEEEGRVPFRRPRPAYVILKQILDEFGVKEAAKKIIVARCKRIGELHPTEVQRMLIDLDSGLKQKETGYVADEYYFALQSEREVEGYEGRGFYPRVEGGEREYGGYYGWGRRETEDRGYRYTPPRARYAEPVPLTEDRLMEILDRRDKEYEERQRRLRLEDHLTDMMKEVISLRNELRTIKENPPVMTPPNVVTKEELERQRADSYMKMLERQVETLEKAVEKYENLLSRAEDRHKEELKEVQQAYKEELKALRDELNAVRKEVGRGEGYKEDTYRFAAEGMHRLADIVERKEPIKVIVQGMRDLSRPEEFKPPREKVGREEITEQIPPEYLEE